MSGKSKNGRVEINMKVATLESNELKPFKKYIPLSSDREDKGWRKMSNIGQEFMKRKGLTIEDVRNELDQIRSEY